jgi:hypothetical protein
LEVPDQDPKFDRGAATLDWPSPAAQEPGGVTARLRIEFADETALRKYTLALASLFSAVAEELAAVDVSGQVRDDLDLREIAQRLLANRVAGVRVDVQLESNRAQVSLALEQGGPRPTVSLTLPVAECSPRTTLWLQADPDHLGPLPVLGLPVVGGAFTMDALHALVAMAGRIGGFVEAQLTLATGGTESSFRWWSTNPPRGAQPVAGFLNDTVWRPGSGGSAEPVAWWAAPAGAEQPAPLRPLASTWLTRFRELLKAGSPLDALELHLRAAEISVHDWKLVDLASAPSRQFMVPPEDGVVSTLIPTPDSVLVAVDVRQPVEVLEGALLHALAHLALGHVRPDDEWSHWDTARSVTSPSPHRAWDKEARDHVAIAFGTAPMRQVESLDQCTPTEKAQLGLWRMIGEMLGESRRLHPAAERYQRAAYQRQAAERIVSMLEDFDGAMLCDGVGLGKTYVATTLMVHYANSWRDRWAATPDRLLEDRFRITVLAPHSVVSTWRREALPGLAAFGVPLATVRVLSHTQLSRISRASELLEPVRGAMSDLEHLLLSDLVIVDEAHNFRSLAARRTKVLRDLLRLQPRRDIRRRVALLTATPINNSLDDLRQEASLLFSRPLWLSDAKTDDGYRRQAIKEVQDRCAKARSARARGDVAPLVIHGEPDAKFSDAIEFRDDLDFGPNVQRIGDYLKEQDKQLKALQDRIRTAAMKGEAPREGAVRIGEDLLDRIVVQRSRRLCKEIERQHSNIELLFRPDASAPEKLLYSDEYDGIEDVLARFLPLFDTNSRSERPARRPLSLKVYMWYDVREGIKSSDDTSSVVGLQRVLVLKRLESSPVSFLITLLRLAVLHAHRLQQLANLCTEVGDKTRLKELTSDIDSVLSVQDDTALAKTRSLATGEVGKETRAAFLKSLSTAYADARAAADTDDPPPQLSLLGDDAEGLPKREQLDRLWTLREALLQDFETLLTVTPELADIVFGKFDQREWPRRFIAGGDSIDWPLSPAWGLRLVTDAKIRQLVGRLVTARRAGQKVVVFSQFSDTIAYIQSVLKACDQFSRTDWQMVVRGGLGVPELKKEELTGLLASTATVTGESDDRDEVVNAFAPFYRIGPWRPMSEEAGDGGRRLLDDAWEASWTSALARPVDIVLSTDVLAEGVNLQDAALLINYDVHWNPVRMIQRAGRIDRRLNPRIEHGRDFSDLSALAIRLNRPVPRYYWHEHPNEPPVTVNMILPDELEAELLLRERIATKTLAIDFTLGLEQGTGAEADWMASYKYQGITSLNSFQRDRAIEQIGGHHERLTQSLRALGVDFSWAGALNAWLREAGTDDGAPLVGRVRIGRRGGDLAVYSRYLEPMIADGMPCWLWTQTKPARSILNFWLCLDGRTFPAQTRADLEWRESQSVPIAAHHLLVAAERLNTCTMTELSPQQVGRPLMQGVTALSAGFLGSEGDRRAILIGEFILLQMRDLGPRRDVGAQPAAFVANQRT